MHKSNKGSYIHIEMLFFDMIGLILSFFVSYGVSQYLTYLFPIQTYLWLLLEYMPVFLLTMYVLNMYHKLTFNYNDRIIKNVFKSTFLSALFIAAMIFYTKDITYSRIFYSSFIFCAFFITTVQRIGYYNFIRNNTGKLGLSQRAIIIGEQDIIDKFEYFLKKTNVTIEVVGYIQINHNEMISSQPNIGILGNLEDVLRNKVVDEVVFAVKSTYLPEIEDAIALCENMGVTARVILNFNKFNTSKVHFSAMGTLPMLTLHTVNLNAPELFLKRVLDIFGAIIGLSITTFAAMIIIPLIKIDSRGPVLFSQKRVGLNGRVFNIYKFRSMHIDAEARKKELMKSNKIEGSFMFKMDNDPRITRVGNFLRKTSLDELPQFINVLKGDMSLVGTRPPTVDEVAKYNTHHYRRISFKPGLTGMWQIKGRSEITNFDQVVKLDTEYIDQWSLWLDIKIIIKTIVVVLKSRGAF